MKRKTNEQYIIDWISAKLGPDIRKTLENVLQENNPSFVPYLLAFEAGRQYQHEYKTEPGNSSEYSEELPEKKVKLVFDDFRRFGKRRTPTFVLEDVPWSSVSKEIHTRGTAFTHVNVFNANGDFIHDYIRGINSLSWDSAIAKDQTC